MEMNPQRVRSAEFKTVRKGADIEEVRVFLGDVANELERAQNQATAMEARARAAVARLQEVTEAPPSAAPAVDATVEESETISRTLLLAQRTADSTVAEAERKAKSVLAQANDEAAKTLDSTREMAARMVEEARTEARQAGAAERESMAEEVDALKARRDFLESDVHHLETFLVDQRARVREAGTALIELAERVPGGIGSVRAPLLSASDDLDDRDDLNDDDRDTGYGAPADAAPESGETPPQESAEDLVIVTEIATGDDGVVTEVDETVVEGDDSARALDSDPWSGSAAANDPTEAMPVFRGESDGDATEAATGDEFRFSFDDDRP